MGETFPYFHAYKHKHCLTLLVGSVLEWGRYSSVKNIWDDFASMINNYLPHRNTEDSLRVSCQSKCLCENGAILSRPPLYPLGQHTLEGGRGSCPCFWLCPCLYLCPCFCFVLVFAFVLTFVFVFFCHVIQIRLAHLWVCCHFFHP